MKIFIKNFLIFLIPIVIIIILIIIVDPFKIFGFYENYYQNNLIGVNRGVVTFTTYNKYESSKKFDSFIFGSSRSQAFKCKVWKGYLDKKAITFHFDSSAEGLWGIMKKIQYIDGQGGSIKNSIIVIDREVLINTKMKEGFLFITPPKISGKSSVDYYYTFFRAALKPRFIISYIDYSIFKKHRKYMKNLISNRKYSNKPNKINCDIWYGYDEHIKTDSSGYYQELINKGIFYKRRTHKTDSCTITEFEIKQLKIIHKIFLKHKTNYKIVISPNYDQIPLEDNQVNLINGIFGKKNVFNFSGKNFLTEPINNYYENSHFRPRVANEIFKEIYQNNKY